MRKGADGVLILAQQQNLSLRNWKVILSLGERLGHGAHGDIEITASPSVIHRPPFFCRTLVCLRGIWQVIVYYQESLALWDYITW